ncbi:hypothetical protein KGM_205815 [Danaus plexippus plexippus]|uniref:Uncharacterized protein n=1 Tax=Danaus plexippus plexippus TaxID=278856 RepID=A0A212FAC1_DANPL|nr:hypothetical protein KGM_205815 [Danaus plexippus plexippus]
MATESHISLIDLTKQLKFEIDDDIKKKLCFAETLVISCGHCEGDLQDSDSDSDWTCDESSESKISDKSKDVVVDKLFDKFEEVPKKESVVEEQEDFHFYFFPDCSKPIPPSHSKASLIVEDGFPKINTGLKKPEVCTCKVDKSGKCPCFLKVPCKCGAKTKHECTCRDAKNICICEEGKPRLVCVCKPSKVCLCHPDHKPMPVCKCADIDKPCICQAGKYPKPICVCEGKPVHPTDFEVIKYEEHGEECLSEETKANTVKSEPIKEPCTCQKLPPEPVCLCVKGKECTCEKDPCICGVLPTCICVPNEDEELICADDESKTVCSCPKEKECTCYSKSPEDCDCFPKPQVCTCGNPEQCICFTTCECVDPCLCDIVQKNKDLCTCEENTTKIAGGLVCTCPQKNDHNKRLKKVRAGKHGYRWCNDVDPKHTFFGYAYERHDKISGREPEIEKTKILGLHDTPSQKEDVCAIHGPIASSFKKRVKKPSLDCCSAVGGISISVEALGEDKDKFLVQIVSHSGKEGAKTGSKLVGILDCSLHTLEENRCEHITKKDLTKEQRSYMAICEDGYYNKVTRICGDRHFVKRIYHSFDVAQNFLLEGANVVLLRYFAINRYAGHVKTKTVLLDGTICESIYISKGVSQAIVNGKPLFVVKVERHIIDPSGFINQSLSVLTFRGYMVSHEWADSSYIFHINPLLRVIPEKDEIESHEPLREKWRSDLQLLSDYLDFKSKRSSEGAKYVSETSELTGVIKDYLQALLLIKPHDALHFTRHYFGSALSALDLPHDEYFDPCTKHVRYYFFEE